MFIVNQEKCIGCGKCAADCFPNDIEITDKKAYIKNIRCIKCGHCIAVCPLNAITSDEYPMEDVIEYNKENFSITPDNLLNFIKFRRSVRHYTKQDVANEDIKKIIEAGRFTQTGSNMQDVSFTVVKDQMHEIKKMTYETLKNMGEEMLKNKEKYTPLILGYAKMWIKMYDEYISEPEKTDRLFFHAPVLVIVSANSPVNAALASSNMELMTDALGLGTFFSGFFIRACQENSKLADRLEISKDKEVSTCMVIGHPDVKYLRTAPRKPADINWK